MGRITDRNGEGLLGVEVLALRRSDFRGHVTVMPAYASRGSTNDLGQFRLFNLSPGEYFVVAIPVHPLRDVGPTRRSGFVTTYYPGRQAFANARRVNVRAGRDVSNINFTLATGPLAMVVVDAVDSRGQPLGREASATLDGRLVRCGTPQYRRRQKCRCSGPAAVVPLDAYSHSCSVRWFQVATSLRPFQVPQSRLQRTTPSSNGCARSRYQ